MYHTISFSLNSMKKIIQTSEKKQILLWFSSGAVDLKCTAKKMNILPISKNLSKYKRVIVVTLIWVFSMYAFIRDFLYRYREDLKDKQVEVVFNHFNPLFIKVCFKRDENYYRLKKVFSFTTCFGHSFKNKGIYLRIINLYK